MDISFVVIDTTTNTLQYSGANNPLYIITSVVLNESEELFSCEAKSNSTIDSSVAPQNDKAKLIELKADKMPVSIYINMNSFTNHVVEIKKGDIIYLSSDGFSDQFGGPSAKKFYSKAIETTFNRSL